MPFMPFQTRPGFYYVYDMNRNSIYKTTEQQYLSLCKVQSGSCETEDVDVLKEFQNKKLLLDAMITKVQHPSTEFLKYQLGCCVNSITLQMSQNCNLRCAYCPYSDNGIYDNRSHSAKNISWETLKKGIDFLVSNSKKADSLHVAFYGGEPLIVKELVIHAMEYAVQQVKGKSIDFGITTNATMLDNDFANAVKDYNISIMVSLDGPKDIHDTNRSFVDGRGSYDLLYKNVSNIKEKYPQLYEKMKFNVVINPDSDYKRVYDFFRNNNGICDISKANFNTLSPNYTDKAFNYGDEYFEERNYETLKAYLILFGKLKDEHITFHKADIEKIFSLKEIFSSITETPPISHPNGTCIPGLKKLFMNVHGDFYPCERVNEKSDLMKIGNVEEGFYIEKIREVLNVGAVTEHECRNCWAFYCCSMCPASVDDGKSEHYSKDYKLIKCNNVKAAALENLKNYAMLREFKYQFDREALS